MPSQNFHASDAASHQKHHEALEQNNSHQCMDICFLNPKVNQIPHTASSLRPDHNLGKPAGYKLSAALVATSGYQVEEILSTALRAYSS